MNTDVTMGLDMVRVGRLHDSHLEGMFPVHSAAGGVC